MYSLAEARAKAGIGRTTLYKAINAGELYATKVGRRTFVTAEALQRWLDEMPLLVPKQATSARSEAP
jgi:excisionase family DNA binding protein